MDVSKSFNFRNTLIMGKQKEITEPYKFTFHEGVRDEAPYVEMFDRCKDSKEEYGRDLTRSEKDNFFHTLQSNSGKSNYKVSGWVFPFRQFMKPFIVRYEYLPLHWYEIWAFDKTCIRKSFYTNEGIGEIKELPR